MQHQKAFVLKEVIVVIVVFVIALALLQLLVGLFSGNTGRNPGRAMPNLTQIRGIHSALVLYAQGNKSYYPGIMSDGTSINPAIGLTTQGRMQILIDGNYISHEFARSPNETQTGPTSFAMLKVDVDHESQTIAKSIRNAEWKETANADAPVISDRAIPVGDSYKHLKSIYTNPSPGTTDWRGHIAWNDNHASFESTHSLTTKYGSTTHASDNLFATDNLNNGDDAFMVFHGTDGL